MDRDCDDTELLCCGWCCCCAVELLLLLLDAAAVVPGDDGDAPAAFTVTIILSNEWRFYTSTREIVIHTTTGLKLFFHSSNAHQQNKIKNSHYCVNDC